MSRIGKKEITIPASVKVTYEKGVVSVSGPKGNLSHEIRPEIGVQISGDNLTTVVLKETKNTPAFWGLTRALIANMVQGVTEGYTKDLELVGVGYRVKSENPQKISLSVGYSHPVEVEAPEGITFAVDGNQNITIHGIDKQLVGLTAAKIRKIRKPEPYKGKGIKYKGEVVRRKAGKAGKK